MDLGTSGKVEDMRVLVEDNGVLVAGNFPPRFIMYNTVSGRHAS